MLKEMTVQGKADEPNSRDWLDYGHGGESESGNLEDAAEDVGDDAYDPGSIEGVLT
jgi:hypothetical protein